ncbi:MAG: GNAT family N-acetyltransferase [Hyphomonadaceae bacterium]
MTPSPLAIERATVATWPAAVTEDHDGWLLLAAGGVTGRVNACWPLDWRGGDADAAIDAVEAWYAARNLPPRFKLTDAAFAPRDLPERLARRGYEAVSATLIMTAPLGAHQGDAEVALSDDMSAQFDAVLRETAKDPSEYDERRAIALRAPRPAAFAMIEAHGAIAAIGMSARANDLTGIFLMRTAPEARRQGHARRILRTLLSQAAQTGAATAFLQVDADNAPAVTLYSSEGFAPVATYRFWRKRA